MASARYTLNITPDSPEEAHVMTPKEKRSNFWFYYKWHIFGALLAVFLVGTFVYDIASRVDPDYQIAILSAKMTDNSILETLETQLATLANDRNGDGKVVVQIMDYPLFLEGETNEEDAPADPYTQMATVTKLSADIQGGDSMLFLTPEVPVYQKQYELFAYNDGTAPAPQATPDYTRMGKLWADCKPLTSLALGNLMYMDQDTGIALQDLLKDYSLVLRIVEGTGLADNKKAVAYAQDAAALFETLTGGV